MIFSFYTPCFLTPEIFLLNKYIILKNQKVILNLHAAKDLNWSYSRTVSQELEI